eukprot:403331708
MASSLSVLFSQKNKKNQDYNQSFYTKVKNFIVTDNQSNSSNNKIQSLFATPMSRGHENNNHSLRNDNNSSSHFMNSVNNRIKSPTIIDKIRGFNNTIKELTLEQFYDPRNMQTVQQQESFKSSSKTNKEIPKNKKKVICLCQQSQTSRNCLHSNFNDVLSISNLIKDFDQQKEDNLCLKEGLEKYEFKDLEIANLIKVFDSYQAQVVELKKEDLMNKFGQFEVEQLNLMHDAEILNQYRKQKKIKVQKELQEITLNKIVAQTQIQTMEMQEKMMIEKYAKLLNINAQDQQKQQ